MNQDVYHAALVLHIIGITLMGGATVMDYLGFRKFWQVLKNDRQGSILFLEIGTTYQRLMGIGMLLIIISGITMMAYMHAIWGEQIWFRIKFVLLLVIILNGLGIRRILGNKLKKELHVIDPDADVILTFSKFKGKIFAVHSLQLFLFVAIYILSVFKFN